MKYLKLITILFILIFFTTGCWDFKDVNDRILVLSVGIDKVGDNVQFMGEAVASRQMSVNTKKNETKTSNFVIYSAMGRSIEDARKDLDRSISYDFFLGTDRVVIFSKEYAREGITAYLNRIENLTDYRKAVIPVVSNNTIKDIYNIKIQNDMGVGFFLENIIKNAKKEGQFYYLNVPQIANKQIMGLGYLLPYISIQNNKLYLDGFAVMSKENKLLEAITKEQEDKLKGILFLLNNNSKFIMNVASKGKENNEYVFNVKLKDKKIKTDYSRGNVNARINLKLDALMQYDYYFQGLNKEISDELRKRLEEQIKIDVINATNNSKDLNCDFLDFEEYFKAQHPNIYKQINWNKEFQNLNIEVNVEVVLKSGTVMNNKKD